MKKIFLFLITILCFKSLLFSVMLGNGQGDYLGNKTVKIDESGNILWGSSDSVKMIDNEVFYSTNNGVDYKRFVPNNLIIVDDALDFGTVINGEYQILKDGYEYILQKQIITPYYFKFEPNCRVKINSSSAFVGSIVYIGTHSLFTANFDDSGSELEILNIYNTPVATPYGGSIFDVKNSTNQSPTSIILVQNSTFLQSSSLGKIENINQIYINVCYFIDNAYGLDIIDTKSTIFLSTKFFNWQNVGTDFLKIEGDVSDIQISNSIMIPGSNDYSVYLSTNINFVQGSSGAMFNSILHGGTSDNFFNPAGISQDNVNLTVKNVTKIENSKIETQVKSENNILTTNIPAVNSLVIANVANCISTETQKQRIVSYSTGASVYIGLENASFQINGVLNLDPASAGTKEIIAQFFKICLCDSYISSFTATTNIVNSTGNILSNGDKISWYDTPGTLPAELRRDVIYFVVNRTTDTFQIAYTQGGAAISFTDNGSGINIYNVCKNFGAKGRSNISAGVPIDIAPVGIVDVKTNEKIVLIVSNLDDSVDINIYNFYYKIFGE